MKTMTLCFLILLTSLTFAQNNALNLNGSDYVVSNSNIDLSGSAITIEAWIFVNSFQATSPYISQLAGVESAGGNTALLRLGDAGIPNGNQIQFVLYTNNTTEKKLTSPTILKTGIWYHIAGTYDGSNMRIYINGVETTYQAEASLSITANGKVSLGGQSDGGRPFDGKIDEVRIWNVSRSEQNIRDYMYKELTTNTNLIVYYKLNETTGTTVANAQGTTGRDGVLTSSGSVTNWVASSAFFGSKNCLNFNGGLKSGTPDYAVKTSNVTSNTDNFTMMAWFKANVVTNGINWRCIAFNGDDGGGYGIGISNGKVGGLFGTTLWATTNEVVTTGQWYHLTMRRSSGTLQFFLNGKLLGYSNTTAPLTPNAKFTIGNMYSNDGTTLYTDSFDGQIDEVSVWDDALTDTQIRDVMCKSLIGDETNLVAYYNLDHTSKSYDGGGIGNDLSLVNIPDGTAWVASTAFNTWLNTNSSTWSTATNWSRGTVPVSSDNVGIYSYSGGSNVSISGNPVVRNLIVASSTTLSLSTGLTVWGNLVLNSNLDPNGQGVSLSSSGTLVEGSGVFYGTSGYIQTTRNLSNITSENVAGLGAVITTSADMGSTVITRKHIVQTNGSNSSIKRYYQITPANNTGLNATLEFNYETNELNSLVENNLDLYKSTDNGSTWSFITGNVNSASNKITISGIDVFSRWSLFEQKNILGVSELSPFSMYSTNGTPYAWGNNQYGNLGDNSTTDSHVPVTVNTTGVLSGKTIVAITGGSHHTVALASDGKIYSWGYNWQGQLGDNSTTDSHVPVAVNTTGVLSGKTVIAIAAGAYFSIALTSDGKVYAWGRNAAGQLGNNSTAQSNVPVAVDTSGVLSGKTITAVAAGEYFSIALASDGKVYAWGGNTYGSLGDSSTTVQSNVPVAVNTSGVLSGKTIIAVKAGGGHSIALASDGKVYAWGRNGSGQLGNNSTTQSNVPVAVNTSGVLSGKTVIAIAGGHYHTVALASDGKVYAWGYNTYYGSLGDSSTIDRHVPVAVNTSGVLSGKTIIAIAGGDMHSIALASDGTVYTWGYNSSGELGNNSTTSSNVPVQVDNSSGALPVELVSFTAEAKGAEVSLNWKTATEVNNYGFSVERKSSFALQNESGGSFYKWETIAFIKGHGNSNSPKDYSYTDTTPPLSASDTIQYRLKQIDTDGNFEYSGIVEVEIDVLTEFKLSQNYPNPFNPTTIIVYQIPKDGFVNLVVYNTLGQVVSTIVNKHQKSGKYSVQFNASNLPSGVYFYKIESGDFSKVNKMLLLR